MGRYEKTFQLHILGRGDLKRKSLYFILRSLDWVEAKHLKQTLPAAILEVAGFSTSRKSLFFRSSNCDSIENIKKLL